MANLYFNETLLADAFAPGAIVEVTGEEARHAVRVSRLRIGEHILIGNGAGVVGEGPVTSAERDRFSVELHRVRKEPAPSQRILLVQALAKGDRDERAIEQATEFGVDALVPWEATRSISRWSKEADGGERVAKGVAKWERIVREASKQSLRPRVPQVRAPASLPDLCASAGEDDTEVIVLHPGGDAAVTEWVTGSGRRAHADIMIVVGPEGGLTDDELDSLERAGAHRLVLGETVLRTSSAGPAALAVLNAALGRW